MIFASKNAYNLYTQSRRDDLISLCYLLIFLIDGDLKFLKNEDEEQEEQATEEQDKVQFKEDDFLRFRKAKNSLKPKDLCDSEESLKLVSFIEEIYKYRFADTPNYNSLRNKLHQVLKDLKEVPDNKYDWNANYVVQEDSLVQLALKQANLF